MNYKIHIFPRGNSETDVKFIGDNITKTTKLAARSRKDAETYLRDLVFYVEELQKVGYKMPEVKEAFVDETNRVVQISEIIPRKSIDHQPSVRDILDVAELLKEKPIDKKGFFTVTPDAALTNFVRYDGQVWLIETMHPLYSLSGNFPYHRTSHSESRVGRWFVDEYIRKRDGVPSRIAFMGARTI